MTMTTLITGAAGFIGSHLARSLLAEGHRVIGVDNFDPFYDRALKDANVAETMQQADGRFELISMDIRDPGLAEVVGHSSVDMIYHMAALAGVRPSIAEPDRYVSVNLDGLTNVLDAARRSRCSQIVFASSSSVYGNNRKVPFAEIDPVDEPISPYAATKRCGELLCHSYCHLFGLRIAAARLFTVFGPAQRPDLAISRFMQLIAAGEPVPRFGDGSTSRDYTYVDDIVDGLRAASKWTDRDDDVRFRIFNIGGSRPVELSTLIESIGEVVGATPQIDQQPLQPGDVDRTFADLTRSTAELGYAPKITLDEGLRRQWAWLQNRRVQCPGASG